MPSTTTAPSVLTHDVTVRNDLLLDSLRAYAANLNSAAILSGYPGRTAVIGNLAKEANLLCKRGPLSVSTALAAAIAKVLTTPATTNFNPGDLVNLTIVSAAEIAAGEYMPPVAVTAEQAELNAVAEANAARAALLDSRAAEREAAASVTEPVVVTKTAEQLRMEADEKRDADDIAEGISRATLDRPWDVSKADWSKCPRKTFVSFVVPNLAQLKAAYAV